MRQRAVMWLIAVLAVLSLALAVYLVATAPAPGKEDCSYYKNSPLNDVPARCVSYFNDQAPVERGE